MPGRILHPSGVHSSEGTHRLRALSQLWTRSTATTFSNLHQGKSSSKPTSGTKPCFISLGAKKRDIQPKTGIPAAPRHPPAIQVPFLGEHNPA